jgi:hypothetical protein
MTKAEIMEMLANVPDGEQVALWAYRFEDYQNCDESITPGVWNEAVKYFDYNSESNAELMLRDLDDAVEAIADEDFGQCDTCSGRYELSSRDGRCGDCGDCGDCCGHA